MKFARIILLLSLVLSLALSNKTHKVKTKTGEIAEVQAWLESLFATETDADHCKKYVEKELTIWGIIVPGATGKGEYTIADLASLIDAPIPHIQEVARCASQNEYLINAAKAGKAALIEDYASFDANKKAEMIKSAKMAVCHSIMFNALTQFIQADYVRAQTLFKKIDAALKKLSIMEVKRMRFYHYTDSFDTIKLNTIMHGINDTLQDLIDKKLNYHDNRKCGVRMNIVGINIGEAMFYDAKADLKDNAYCGAVMVVTPAGENTIPELEVEPAKFSKDGKVPLQFQPFPDLWADVYSIWNLAFTARQMEDFPMYWAKLLTPAVGCYRKEKGSYIFNRALNLLLHIVHEIFIRNERKSKGPGFDVRLPKFIKSFGQSNKISAYQYYTKVQKEDPNKESKAERKRKLDLTKAVVDGISQSFWKGAVKFFSTMDSECTLTKQREEEAKQLVESSSTKEDGPVTAPAAQSKIRQLWNWVTGNKEATPTPSPTAPTTPAAAKKQKRKFKKF